MQYTLQKDLDYLDLHIYYSPDSISYDSYLYEDDYKTYKYETGDSLLRTFTYQTNKQQIKIKQSQNHEYQSNIHKFKITLHGFPWIRNIFSSISTSDFKQNNSTYYFEISSDFREITIEI